MWFESLMGFREESPDQVRSLVRVDGNRLTSLASGESYVHGTLETPTLAELRERVASTNFEHSGRLKIEEIVANVQELHRDSKNTGALFQVASQFNLLEMTSPGISPEYGVDRYELDRTQGPACAVAAGAGTIYRNYFVNINGQQGQTSQTQIDCSKEIGVALGNDNNSLWEIRNGYLLPSFDGLSQIRNKLTELDEEQRTRLRSQLRIGIQWNTEVTISESRHVVTQVYCSAVPVTYSALPSHLWAEFAKLILEAAYEATLAAAVLNLEATNNPKVFLTFLGGGAFGNSFEWIIDSMKHALQQFNEYPLHVYIVSYGGPKAGVRDLINDLADT
jgi:hypothetical protein